MTDRMKRGTRKESVSAIAIADGTTEERKETYENPRAVKKKTINRMAGPGTFLTESALEAMNAMKAITAATGSDPVPHIAAAMATCIIARSAVRATMARLARLPFSS